MSQRIDALWSPAALQDLIDIWVYFAKLASPEIADLLVDEINGVGVNLIENPLHGRERPDLLRGIRCLPVNPYMIFYRVSENIPEIVRVIHQRRDVAGIFSPSGRQREGGENG